ncbi:uncharacterized protein [Diabrotica undecimpunctata]|uniref:uncharacterized protein n=1 Tax=Diabrotica undecimpunctata TaxID=50387 RepID=UPI003B63509C
MIAHLPGALLDCISFLSSAIGEGVNLNSLLQHFAKHLNTEITADPVLYAEPFILNEHLDRPFNMEELQIALDSLKPNKAPGVDRIAAEFLSENGKLLVLGLANNFFVKPNFPRGFYDAIIFPLYKKGNMESAGSYRGISFLNAVTKLIAALTLTRLTS